MTLNTYGYCRKIASPTNDRLESLAAIRARNILILTVRQIGVRVCRSAGCTAPRAFLL